MAWSYIYQTDKETSYKATRILILVIVIFVIYSGIDTLLQRSSNGFEYTLSNIDRKLIINADSTIYVLKYIVESKTINAEKILLNSTINSNQVFIRYSVSNPLLFEILVDTIPADNGLNYGKSWLELEPTMYKIEQKKYVYSRYFSPVIRSVRKINSALS